MAKNNKKKFADVKGIDECYKIAGVKPIEKWEDVPEEMRECLMAGAKQMVVVKAANLLRGQDKPLSWRDHNLRKWFGWLQFLSSGGLAFYDALYCYSGASAGGASRLAFLEEADVRKAFEIAPQVFEDFLTK
jgi:hypothetical protein